MTKRFRTSIALLLVLSLAVGLGLAGCKPGTGGGGGAGTEPVSGGTLKFYVGEVAYIDPYNVQESEGTEVEQAVFDSLTALDPLTLKVIPAAAESWKSNADATVWTFKLVKGAKFHDGSPVTAKDFKYAWERILNPKTNPDDPSVIDYHLYPIKGVQDFKDGKATDVAGIKVVDDLTLEITLDKAFADWAAVCAHPALAPVPKAAVEKDPKAFADMPIGNGPFKMKEPWKHDQYIKVVRFDDYYGKKPYLDAIDFLQFKDEATGFREFEAGNLDFVPIPTGKIADSVAKYGKSDDGYTAVAGKQVMVGVEAATYFLIVNQKDKVVGGTGLTDEKAKALRRALSAAINREAICATVYEDTRRPASGPVPPPITGFQKDAWPTAVYSVETAKKELVAAGYPEGKGLPEIILTFNTGAGHESLMQLIQADWAKVGINAKLDGLEWPAYLQKTQAGEYQIGRMGWIADYPIVDNFIFPLFYTGVGDNRSQYSNPAIDKMIDEARAITDETERLAAYNKIEKKIGEDMPLIPITFYAHRHVASDRVGMLVFSTNGISDFNNAWLLNGGKAKTATK